MSAGTHKRTSAISKPRATAAVGHPLSAAPLFLALADDTRLALIARLSGGEPRSISQLTHGTRLTRQAVTKHLRVLEGAGLVHSTQNGRENRFQLDIKPLETMKNYLESVSRQWDETLERLKSFVER